VLGKNIREKEGWPGDDEGYRAKANINAAGYKLHPNLRRADAEGVGNLV
jgi:hypothetical protein